jgi:hypothetical protein
MKHMLSDKVIIPRIPEEQEFGFSQKVSKKA